MKKIFFILFICDFLKPALAQNNIHGNQAKFISGTAMCFIENKGQVTDQYGKKRGDIDYKITASPALNIFIGNGAIHYQFSKPAAPHDVETQCIASLPHTRNTSFSSGEDRREVSMYRLDMVLEGANPHAHAIAKQPQRYYEHYFTAGINEKNAVANSFKSITYENIYPNIDWVLYIKDNQLEYDFIIRPGGNPNNIKIHYNGAAALQTAKDAITAFTPLGKIIEGKLYCYQQDNHKEIASSFQAKDNTVRLKVGKHSGTLVIDPRLEWASYYGGDNIYTESATLGYKILADTSGNIYTTGYTASIANIATTGAYDAVYSGSYDAFLSKFSSSGTMEWATYYGGNGDDNAYTLALDDSNNIYIGGITTSTNNIATAGAWQIINSGGDDAFIAKFASSGALLWATYYGGSGFDNALGMSCDSAGDVYVTGFTSSPDSIATPGAYKPTYTGDGDAFLAKFSSAGLLLWATYYGGTGVNEGFGVSCDMTVNLYMTGATSSTDSIATPGVYQTIYGGGTSDVFVAKFTVGGALTWSTYYGGSGQDKPAAIVCDSTGNIYLTGLTSSPNDIATAGAYDTVFVAGITNTFLAKFTDNGDLVWATYFGGDSTGSSAAHGIAADNNGHIYLGGETNSINGIATPGAYKNNFSGTYDAFIAEFSAGGSLLWGSYFGADTLTFGMDITSDNNDNFYLLGQTMSPNGIASPGAYDTAYYGDGVLVTFIAKFDSLETNGVQQIASPGSEVNIYPNPANDFLTIKWSSHAIGVVQISVINMEGQQLYTTSAPSSANHTAIPVSNLPDGMYVCVL